MRHRSGNSRSCQRIQNSNDIAKNKVDNGKVKARKVALPSSVGQEKTSSTKTG
jgi:hypothetical protein